MEILSEAGEQVCLEKMERSLGPLGKEGIVREYVCGDQSWPSGLRWSPFIVVYIVAHVLNTCVVQWEKIKSS